MLDVIFGSFPHGAKRVLGELASFGCNDSIFFKGRVEDNLKIPKKTSRTKTIREMDVDSSSLRLGGCFSSGLKASIPVLSAEDLRKIAPRTGWNGWFWWPEVLHLSAPRRTKAAPKTARSTSRWVWETQTQDHGWCPQLAQSQDSLG